MPSLNPRRWPWKRLVRRVRRALPAKKQVKAAYRETLAAVDARRTEANHDLAIVRGGRLLPKTEENFRLGVLVKDRAKLLAIDRQRTEKTLSRLAQARALVRHLGPRGVSLVQRATTPKNFQGVLDVLVHEVEAGRIKETWAGWRFDYGAVERELTQGFESNLRAVGKVDGSVAAGRLKRFGPEVQEFFAGLGGKLLAQEAAIYSEALAAVRSLREHGY